MIDEQESRAFIRKKERYGRNIFHKLAIGFFFVQFVMRLKKS